MKQTATAADRLDPRVVEEIGHNMNEKNQILAFEVYKRNSTVCLGVLLDSIACFV